MILSAKWEMQQDIEVEDTEKTVERCVEFLDTPSVINEDCTVPTKVFI